MRALITGIILFLHCSGSFFAQQDSSLSFQHFDSTLIDKLIPEIIISGSRISPISINRIDAKKINEFQGPSIEPLLNQQPGIWMQTGALNTNRISIRGTGYREPFATSGIKVYWDEFPITNGAGESNIEDIHPRMLKGIDIYKGPASALWGQGLGGMIHFISAQPDSNSYETRITAGSFGRFQFDQHLAFTDKELPGFSTALHYQFLNDDGYRSNNHYGKHSVSFLPVLTRDKYYLRGLIHIISLKAGLPSSLNIDNFNNNPWKAEANWENVGASEKYTRIISGIESGLNINRDIQYKGSVYFHSNDLDEVRPFNILEENSLSFGTRHRLLAQHNDLTYSAGFEYQKEDYRNTTFETPTNGIKGERLGDQNEIRSYLSIFAQSSYRLSDHWLFFGGLSTHLTSLKYEDQKRNFPLALFPTFSLTWRTFSNLEIKALVSRGYTPLTATNVLDSQGNINRTIVPESGWNQEINFMWSNRGGGADLIFNLATYAMQVKNTVLIERFEEDNFRTYNGGESRSFGIEIGGELNFSQPDLKWEFSYTWNDSRFGDFDQLGPQIKGRKLPGIPEHRMYQSLRWPTKKIWSLNLDYFMTGSVNLTDQLDLKGRGSNVFNLGGRYTIRIAQHSLKLDARIMNLFNLKYASMFQINAPGNNPRYYYPGRPRSVYLTLVFELG